MNGLEVHQDHSSTYSLDIACVHGELFKTAQGLKRIFMMLPVEFIDSNSELYNELGPSTWTSARLSGYEVKVYNFFLYHSWQRIVLTKSFKVILDNYPMDSASYLRYFNIFVTAVGEDQMQLVSPMLVSHLLWKEKFRDSFLDILGLVCSHNYSDFPQLPWYGSTSIQCA